MGINVGYFAAFFRVCLVFVPQFLQRPIFAIDRPSWTLLGFSGVCCPNRLIKCSQTTFVDFISVVVFFNVICRLTDFSSDPFDSSSSKTE